MFVFVAIYGYPWNKSSEYLQLIHTFIDKHNILKTLQQVSIQRKTNLEFKWKVS